MSDLHCCDAFRDSTECCTDNEAFGALTRRRQDVFTIGVSLPPIKFCPWCGADKTTPHPLVLAARNVVDARGRTWESLKNNLAELEHELNLHFPKGNNDG
jgi:hypothetical protein